MARRISQRGKNEKVALLNYLVYEKRMKVRKQDKKSFSQSSESDECRGIMIVVVDACM